MTCLRPSRTTALLLSVAVLSTSWCLSQGTPAPDKNASAEVETTPDAASEEARNEELAQKIESFGWQREGTVKIGSNAEIKMPPGLKITNGAGAGKLLKLYHNIPSGREAAILGSEALGWWATFEFTEEGYVKDDEKNDIDADKTLETMRENVAQGNEERKAQGLSPYEITGWAVKPFYNQESKSLEFGFLLGTVGAPPGHESVNYSTKILGRRGYMDIMLVCSPDVLNESLTALRNALKGFNYVSGETYAEYRKGDKVAEYGLTALVAGGALAVAAKSGLLAKLWKYIIIGVAALVGGLKKLFKKKSDTPPSA